MDERYLQDTTISEVMKLIERAGFPYNDFTLTPKNGILLKFSYGGDIREKIYLDEFAQKIVTILAQAQTDYDEKESSILSKHKLSHPDKDFNPEDMEAGDIIPLWTLIHRISILKDLSSVVEYWLSHPDAYSNNPQPTGEYLMPQTKVPRIRFEGTKTEFVNQLADEYSKMNVKSRKSLTWRNYVCSEYPKYDFPWPWKVEQCYDLAKKYTPR